MVAKSITSKDLNSVLQTVHKPTIFDVRKKPAFDASPNTLPNASWQVFNQIEKWSADLSADIKANQIIVYCVHGHEVSQNAAQELNDLGFNAAYLEGGIAAWIEQGYSLANSD